jgi:hypothetical protein
MRTRPNQRNAVRLAQPLAQLKCRRNSTDTCTHHDYMSHDNYPLDSVGALLRRR